ncbi:MAG TPA: hypothetical protein PLO89_06525 [Spirochaetota bacterium]|nr:hypothetical protein [Spirochaetota bacterium]
MKKKRSFLNFLSLLLLVLFLFALSGCEVLAKTLVYPNRQPVVKTPQDYGMKFENITVKSDDNVNLKGWVIPGKNDSLCIITHPMNFTKYGYSVKNQGKFKVSDIEVEFLKTAKILNDLGHSVLTFDFRNHGESDKGSDGITGVGLNEWSDVLSVLDFVNNTKDLKDKKIFFLSYCMGANSTIIAYYKNKEKFANVRFFILVQPISMDVFVDSYINSEFPILKGLIPTIEKKCVELGGFEFKKMSPYEYCENLDLPVLFVQAKSDKWTKLSDIESFYEKAAGYKETFYIEGKMHRFDTYNYFSSNPERMIRFINERLR